jgi:cytochrome P450 family 6
VQRRYTHWKKLGVPYVEPTFPFGNVAGYNIKTHPSVTLASYYKSMKSNGPFFGLFLLFEPLIMVTDLDLIKTILVKDFNYFMNRGLYVNEVDDPLSGHLFSVEDQKWRDLRTKLTPTFTSGKIKYMFTTILGVADELKKCVTLETSMSDEIEFKQILVRFTTDVIGTCAFGIDCNSLIDPNAEFHIVGQQVFKIKPLRRLLNLFLMNNRSVGRKFHLALTEKRITDFFFKIVNDTIGYRKSNNVERNDFMSMLMKMMQDDGVKDGLTIDEITAQAFVFFIAGFETSSTVMSYALLELSRNAEIQEKARQEIEDVLAKHNGQFTYEAMMDMKYLEQIINESLRKSPPLGHLFRVVTKDYHESKTGITMKKGTRVFIPILGIQMDPDYFPEPEKFDPDRFTGEEIKKRNPYTFLPFGEGPRNCIGLRFGMMQARIGLATLLTNFKFTKSSKTQYPMKFNTKSITLTSEDGLWLHVDKI